MLILHRGSGESIIIGDDIKVKVLEFDGRNVDIGIEAPDDVDIWRGELYWQIKHDQDNNT